MTSPTTHTIPPGSTDPAGGTDRRRSVSVVVAATGDGGRNLLVARLARARFGVATVVLRVDRSEHVESFRSQGYETVCVESNGGAALADRLG